MTALEMKQQNEQMAVGPYGLATVTIVAEGVPLAVRRDGECADREVTARLASVPRIVVGARVLICMVDSGPVIVGRLLQAGEAPAARLVESEGVVEICGERGVVIRSGESIIELGADGRIRINGREVDVTAEGRMSLFGPTLTLN